MASIIDYVRSCTDSFADKKPNRVDSLVFSSIVYARIPEAISAATTAEGIALADVPSAASVTRLAGSANNEAATADLIRACAESPRFSQLRACLGVAETSDGFEKQFGALAFVLPEGGAFIAFRGTDDSLVGWKENFNMAFRDTVPSQEAARAYVESVAAQVTGPLWIGGHSKGGNLAMYATISCPPAVRDRIARCFAHDAPGFKDTVVANPGGVQAQCLIDKTLPSESFIGLLLEAPKTDPIIVRSTKSGIRQHDPFSWVVEGDDFAHARALSYDAFRNGKRMGAWLSTMSSDERERFIEILYGLMTSSGETSMSSLLDSLATGALPDFVHQVDALPETDRAFFRSCLGELVATMVFGPARTDPKTPAEKVDAVMDRVEDASARLDDGLSRLDKYAGL